MSNSNGGVNTKYAGAFEYDYNSYLTRIATDEGQITVTGNGANYEVQYYLRDNQNNVRMVINEAGTIVQETEYFPFGLAIPRSGTDAVNKFKVLGREEQAETGWVDLMKRMYDPATARFTSVDPSPDVERQESLSTYQYGWNNPVLRSDPNGDCPNCVTGAIGAGIGALIGGAIEAGTQLYHDGKVSNWSAVGGAALQGGITGGAAGFTGGASLLVTTSVSAGANVVGGAINNTIQGKEITAKSVAVDAAVGVAAGVGGKVLDKVLSKAQRAVASTENQTVSVTSAYKRPSGSVTVEQRASVQGKPCVDCGTKAPTMVADHKTPLVKEYYQTGTIDKTKMRSVDAVQPQCPTCSARQGAEMSKYSKEMKKANGL